MTRDSDLLRDLMFTFEKISSSHRIHYYTAGSDDLKALAPGYSDEEIFYHIQMLAQDGFIECPNNGADTISFRQLTSKGHDFVERERKSQPPATSRIFAKELGFFVFDKEKHVLRYQHNDLSAVRTSPIIQLHRDVDHETALQLVDLLNKSFETISYPSR